MSTKPYPLGVDLINSGKCPKGGITPMACMFCMEGHMLECHYGMTCDEAECSHYQRELAAEGYGDDKPKL